MKLLIKNSNVVFANEIKKKDLLIENGLISKIEDFISNNSAEKIINSSNLFCMPGLIDLHVHLREPGFCEKETIKTGSNAAAKGGVTSLVCMANTNPVMDSYEKILKLQEKLKKQKIKIYPICSITKNLEGKQLVDFSKIASLNICGISDDGVFVLNSNLMKTALKKAKKLNLVVFSHCEDPYLFKKNPLKNDCEAVAVARDAALAYTNNCPVHICHVSTKQSVEIIRAFKKLKTKITAQTCPHYFMLTKKETKKKDANFKMNPPLRSEKDILAIENALKDGTIDCIATDHAPHQEQSKKNFKTAANGVIGLETFLSCTLTHFFKTKKLSLPFISKLISKNPAKILNLKNVGEIKTGNQADLILVDLNKSWTVLKKDFVSKSKNSPFIGKSLTGVLKYTFCRGKLIYKLK